MGPIFLLLFVNDVPNTLNCNVMLFADNSKLYSTINEEQDCINLQADLDFVPSVHSRSRRLLCELSGGATLDGILLVSVPAMANPGPATCL